MLIAGLLVTSCHDKMENEYISNPVTVKTEEFEKAFKEAFTSDIAPNQDWGFGSSSAGTRAFTRAGEPEVVKKDVWQNFPAKLDGNTVPADVTKKEAKYVYEWFQKDENKGLTEEGLVFNWVINKASINPSVTIDNWKEGSEPSEPVLILYALPLM